jgi:hydroxymethylpyrimidine/phosphomethylpyrimidine kinase
MSVITVLTAQNTRGVTGIHAVPPAFAVQRHPCRPPGLCRAAN